MMNNSLFRHGWVLILGLAMVINAPCAWPQSSDHGLATGTEAAGREEPPGVNTVWVAASGDGLRQNPTLESEISSELEPGTRGWVVAIQGDWLLVESATGSRGWAPRALFADRPPGDSEQVSNAESDLGATSTAEISSTGSGSIAAESGVAADTQPPTGAASEADQTATEITIQSAEDQRITLNFTDIDIRKLLSALAINQETSIVMAPKVVGKISVHLYQVSLAEAIDAITLAGGFGYRQRGSIHYIYKPEEDKHPEADWLQVKTFRVRYNEAQKIQDLLESLPDLRMATYHQASKTIFVEDTPENIARVEALLRYWDAPPRQVLIEARILEINLTEDMSLGVNWEQMLGNVRFGTGGMSTAILPGGAVVPAADALLNAAGGGKSPIPGDSSGFFGNLIAGAGTWHEFQMAIDALQTKTQVNVLSSPKLLAIHGKSASVQVGGRQGYKVATSNLGILTESIEFINTGTILRITPFVDENNNILLEVRPSINSATLEDGIPVVKSTLVNTWLLAKSGETAFIGGLIQDIRADARSQVPCIGSIPWFKPLFGRSVQGIDKTETVVLITPRILETAGGAEARAGQKRVEQTEADFPQNQMFPEIEP